MTLKVSLDALSSDAARWGTASQALVGAGQGASETDEIAATLREVRRVHESTDEDAKQRLKGSWDAAG